MVRTFIRNTFAATAMALSLGAVSAHAEDSYSIFDRNTAFHLFGDDKLGVVGIGDPLIDGVVCVYVAPKKGGIGGALGLATEASDVSLSCRQVGPIAIKAKFKQGDDMSSVSRSILFKTLHVARGCDVRTNMLVYMVFTDKLIDGSPKNSVSTIPIMPWGDSKDVVKCADFVR